MYSVYSFDDKEMHSSVNAPKCCGKFFADNNRRCRKFYDKCLNSNYEDGTILCCPYGFSCIVFANEVYTGLIIKEESDYSKVKGNIEQYNKKINDYSQYNRKDILILIQNYRELKKRMEIFEKTVHDIKNATRSMLDITENIENETKLLSDNKVYNAIVGYGLIKYRLDYHDYVIDGKGIIEQRRGSLNAHKMMNKLSHQMYYRARKKGIEIQLQGSTSVSVLQNASLYLGFFQLIENAVKYAVMNSEVIISFRDISSDEVEVRVENVCNPILEEEINKLTQKGYRASRASINTNGSGLGLFLAKEIFDEAKCAFKIIYKTIGESKGQFIVEVRVKSLQAKE